VGHVQAVGPENEEEPESAPCERRNQDRPGHAHETVHASYTNQWHPWPTHVS
jgi:hypothetical protein